jgi:hypothetical protein
LPGQIAPGRVAALGKGTICLGWGIGWRVGGWQDLHKLGLIFNNLLDLDLKNGRRLWEGRGQPEGAPRLGKVDGGLGGGGGGGGEQSLSGGWGSILEDKLTLSMESSSSLMLPSTSGSSGMVSQLLAPAVVARLSGVPTLRPELFGADCCWRCSWSAIKST